MATEKELAYSAERCINPDIFKGNIFNDVYCEYNGKDIIVQTPQKGSF